MVKAIYPKTQNKKWSIVMLKKLCKTEGIHT